MDISPPEACIMKAIQQRGNLRFRSISLHPATKVCLAIRSYHLMVVVGTALGNFLYKKFRHSQKSLVPQKIFFPGWGCSSTGRVLLFQLTGLIPNTVKIGHGGTHILAPGRGGQEGEKFKIILIQRHSWVYSEFKARMSCVCVGGGAERKIFLPFAAYENLGIIQIHIPDTIQTRKLGLIPPFSFKPAFLHRACCG